MISVVIPVYNAERFLGECLASVASQSYADFEAIVVDDGSTDRSSAIAEEFCRRDKRFRLLRQPNSGVSAARNLGIDASRGELLGFVDADDALHPRALETLLTVIDDCDCDVCVASMKEGEEMPAWNRMDVGMVCPVIMDYEQAMRKALYQKIILNSPCGMLMKRNLLGSDIRFRPGTRFEDLDAFYRFYEHAGRIAYLPDKLYFYRRVPTSFIHSWDVARLDALAVTDRMVEFMHESYPSLEAAAADRRFSAYYNTLLRLLKFQPDDSATISRCYALIRQRSRSELSDPEVRLKNKLGALLSRGGIPLLRLLARLLPLR